LETISAALLHRVLAHPGFDLESKIIPEMRCQLALQMHQTRAAGPHRDASTAVS